MWCYFCDGAKGGTLFPSSVTCIFPLFEHSKGSTFIRLSKRIERIFAFFCLLFYTLYIYAGARFAWLCPSWSRTTTPHYTRTREVAFGASWTLLSSLSSPRENLKFMEERADGSEFSILRGCVILECLGGFLFSSPRENREFVTKRVRRLRIFDSQRLPFGASWRLLVSLFSPRENLEFVTRGWRGSKF